MKEKFYTANSDHSCPTFDVSICEFSSKNMLSSINRNAQDTRHLHLKPNVVYYIFPFTSRHSSNHKQFASGSSSVVRNFSV